MPFYARAVVGAMRRRPSSSLPVSVKRATGVEVEIDRLAAYDRICGFHLSDAVPATYPHVLAFPLAMDLMTAPAFPFSVLGLVHIGNSITVHRPVLTSSRLDFEVSASDMRPHDRGQQFDVIAVGSIDGEEVWRGVSTYLRRSGSRSSAVPVTATSAGEPSALWTVGRDVGRVYARVSGDRNPIHTSTLGAKAFGFPRPIAHGMWSAARCLAALEGTLPDTYTLDVSFKRPILLPSTVAFTGAGLGPVTLTDPTSGAPHLIGTVSSGGRLPGSAVEQVGGA